VRAKSEEFDDRLEAGLALGDYIADC